MKQEIQSSVRDTLADVATHLFCEKGYGSTSVNEIATAAGITKPVLYYYFGSKAGLFTTLYKEHFSHFSQQLREARAHSGPIREKLLHFVRRHLDYCQKHPARIRFIFNIVYGPKKGHPPIPLHFEEMDSETTIGFNALLDEAKRRDEIRELPNLHLGLAFIGMLNMFMAQQLRAPDWPTTDAAEKLVDIFLTGVQTTGSNQN